MQGTPDPPEPDPLERWHIYEQEWVYFAVDPVKPQDPSGDHATEELR